MAKKLNRDIFRIGDTAVRIIFLKTVVGMEESVYISYKKYLDDTMKDSGISEFFGFKIFGEYDLCFIIFRRDFKHDMAYSGTIEGIVYSTEVLCFMWDNLHGSKRKSVKKGKYFNKPLICVSIIKLAPFFLKNKDNDDFNKILSSFMNNENIMVFGNLGWGEIVLVYASDTFNEIYSSFIQKIDPKIIKISVKLFSQIGIKFDMILDNSIENCLSKDEMAASNAFYPSVFISCRPSEIVPLYNKFLSYMKNLTEIVESTPMITYGSFDFTVEITKGKWGEFIGKLIEFRRENRISIFKTSVQIKGANSFSCSEQLSKSYYLPKTIKISSAALSKIKDISTGAKGTILATVYTFNQYLQNELLYDSIEDMVDYVDEMKTIAFDQTLRSKFHSGKLNQTHLEYLETMINNIKDGCNQRLGGYFLQEGTEDFSPYKGGKQVLLKALKAVCNDISNNIGLGNWTGFINIGKYNYYSHYYKLIIMPYDITFSVEMYFGIFHEICHLYRFSNTDEMVSFEDVIIDDKDKLFGESLCDLFAFQCGFLCDYELYEKSLLSFLSELIHTDGNYEKAGEYSLRMLFVYIYKELSNKEVLFDDEKLNDKNLDLENKFDEKLDYIVKTLLNNDNESYVEIYREIITKKAEFLSFSKTISVYFGFLYKHKTNWEQFYLLRKDKYGDKKIQSQTKRLLNGEVLYDVEHPQLIILSLMREKIINGNNISFKTNMAAIQSFIECYYKQENAK
ncbi:MAG: hypothetical protein H7844_11240 [Nitrospirae bacterium YQR-1]